TGAIFEGGEHFVAAFNIASGAHADDTSVPALRFESEEVVEGSYPVNAAGRELEFGSNKQQQVIFQKAKKILGLVQHFDERILLELMLLHVRFQNLETLIPAGVTQNLWQPVLFRP